MGYRPRELTWSDEKIDAHAQRVLQFAGLGEVADLLPEDLSGGTQRLVAIARAIVDQPEIIFFDEPTVGLDPPTVRKLCNAAIRLRDLENVTSMFVTHKLADVRYLASHYAVKTAGMQFDVRKENNELCLINTKFIVLHDGKIIFDGTDEELWAAEDPFLQSFTRDDEESLMSPGDALK